MGSFISEYWFYYLKGLGVGVLISVIAMAVSVTLGTLGAFGRRSRSPWLRAIAGGYVAVFRGIPPLVMLYLVYFGLPAWAQANHVPVLAEVLTPLNNRLVAAVAAFAVTSGAYSTEIIRAALGAIGQDQVEAARSLGMSTFLTMRRIVGPQAFSVAIPPLGNEFIAVIKGTSLASVIGVVELMRAAQIAASATFQNLLAYSMAGVYYVLVVSILQLGVTVLERRIPGSAGRRKRLRRHRRRLRK